MTTAHFMTLFGEKQRLEFSWPIQICDLSIKIFADSYFLSIIYNGQHIQTKIYANFNTKFTQ